MSMFTWRSRVYAAEARSHGFDVADQQDAQNPHRDPLSEYQIERNESEAPKDLALRVALALFTDAVVRDQFTRAHCLLDAIELRVAVIKSSNTATT